MYSCDEMQNLKNEMNEDAASDDDLFDQAAFYAIGGWTLTHTDANGVEYFAERGLHV